MRVVLVGAAGDRARLRAELNGSMEIAGEFISAEAARAAGADVYAMLIAPSQARGPQAAGGRSRSASSDADNPGIEGSEPLTPREREVLELLALGLPNK